MSPPALFAAAPALRQVDLRPRAATTETVSAPFGAGDVVPRRTELSCPVTRSYQWGAIAPRNAGTGSSRAAFQALTPSLAARRALQARPSCAVTAAVEPRLIRRPSSSISMRTERSPWMRTSRRSMAVKPISYVGCSIVLMPLPTSGDQATTPCHCPPAAPPGRRCGRDAGRIRAAPWPHGRAAPRPPPASGHDNRAAPTSPAGNPPAAPGANSRRTATAPPGRYRYSPAPAGGG
ncbi:conserved hypothetical protein [Ricinus communis]|uniref:Uncharacterized protein n=1 Tax=Ricinus communis TaxID=3988 RepID=B9TKI8_RICCO|nr:conserved hypothetical protein [Ricinus communis]